MMRNGFPIHCQPLPCTFSCWMRQLNDEKLSKWVLTYWHRRHKQFAAEDSHHVHEQKLAEWDKESSVPLCSAVRNAAAPPVGSVQLRALWSFPSSARAPLCNVMDTSARKPSLKNIWTKWASFPRDLSAAAFLKHRLMPVGRVIYTFAGVIRRA